MGLYKEGAPARKELTTEEVQDAQIGLLEWELEERDKHHSIDHLTGANTRKMFEHDLERSLKIVRGEVEEHRQGAEPLREVSVVFIDLDHFKHVNDTLGHAEGDAVLIKVTELLQGALRATDMLARYGGDEFVVLLPNTSEKNAVVVAEHLRTSLENDAKLKGLGVTASIGICSSSTSDTHDPKTLVTQADSAAYVAKKGGRNRVEVYKKGDE